VVPSAPRSVTPISRAFWQLASAIRRNSLLRSLSSSAGALGEEGGRLELGVVLAVHPLVVRMANVASKK
jgi:hypothetical protein